MRDPNQFITVTLAPEGTRTTMIRASSITQIEPMDFGCRIWTAGYNIDSTNDAWAVHSWVTEKE